MAARDDPLRTYADDRERAAVRAASDAYGLSVSAIVRLAIRCLLDLPLGVGWDRMLNENGKLPIDEGFPWGPPRG